MRRRCCHSYPLGDPGLKTDVTWKYTRPQIEWLERKGHLK
jgi:hypothetical protein